MLSPILLLEDHKMITDCYAMSLHSLAIDSEVIISHSLRDAYAILTKSCFSDLRLAVLDYSMPECELNNLKNGSDIALIIRSKFPEAKIIFISGQLNSLELEYLQKTIEPEGIAEKSDINYSDLGIIFQQVLDGEHFFSARIHRTMRENQSKYLFLDAMNLKIIELLSQGIATKNLPNHLPLSLSGVHKRKAKIKAVLNIENGSDEAIIKEARKQGLI